MAEESIREQKGIYYSDCELKANEKSFKLQCKKGEPAVRIQAEKSED